MQSLQAGSTLGKFEILAEIGQGGMSVVYKARDKLVHREVALKVLHRFLADQPEARERFQKEAVAFGRLRHPHIIELYEYSHEQDDASYLVTELVDGIPLSRLLEAGPFAPPEAALVLGLPIAAALAHAHAKGVYHRDLKPENILVGSTGVLKLTDFGIAKVLGTESFTTTGALLGSPAYMAPEYIDGQEPDARADIFSFGAMLYHFAVGELPFSGPSAHALLKRISGGDYEAPERRNPRIHAQLARIIKRCLATRPDDRYPNTDELRDEIAAVLDRLGIEPEAARRRLLSYRKAYEQELTQHLLPRYVASGKALLRQGRTGAAVEDFDRVLCDEPEHAEVRTLVDRLSRRNRLRRAAQLAAVGIAMVAAGGAAAHVWRWWQAHATATRPSPAVTSPWQGDSSAAGGSESEGDAEARARAEAEGVIGREVNVTFLLDGGQGALYLDGALAVAAADTTHSALLTPGRHVATFVGNGRTAQRAFWVPQIGPMPPIALQLPGSPEAGSDGRVVARAATSGGDESAEARGAPSTSMSTSTSVTEKGRTATRVKEVTVRPAGQWVTVFLNDDAQPVAREQMREFKLSLTYGAHKLVFTNDKAQPLEMVVRVDDDEPADTILVRLRPIDARLRVTGAPDGSVVEVGDRRSVINESTRDTPIFVPLPEGRGEAAYEVVVRGRDGETEIARERLVFHPGEEEVLAVPAQPR